MKVLIFDAGTLINFSINGIEELIAELKRINNARFVITYDVKKEIVKRPLNTKKYELSALKMKKLIDDKIIEMPSDLNVDNNELAKKTKIILNKINKSFYAKGKPIHLIENGEASSLALYEILENNKDVEQVVMAVDERTTRMIGEKPGNLQKLLEKKLHTSVQFKNKDLRKYNFIRSAELVYIAYKKGLVDLEGNVLDALLYAVKFAGCSISREEIDEIKKLK